MCDYVNKNELIEPREIFNGFLMFKVKSEKSTELHFLIIPLEVEAGIWLLEDVITIILI